MVKHFRVIHGRIFQPLAGKIDRDFEKEKRKGSLRHGETQLPSGFFLEAERDAFSRLPYARFYVTRFYILQSAHYVASLDIAGGIVRTNSPCPR